MARTGRRSAARRRQALEGGAGEIDGIDAESPARQEQGLPTIAAREVEGAPAGQRCDVLDQECGGSRWAAHARVSVIPNPPLRGHTPRRRVLGPARRRAWPARRNVRAHSLTVAPSSSRHRPVARASAHHRLSVPQMPPGCCSDVPPHPDQPAAAWHGASSGAIGATGRRPRRANAGQDQRLIESPPTEALEV